MEFKNREAFIVWVSSWCFNFLLQSKGVQGLIYLSCAGLSLSAFSLLAHQLLRHRLPESHPGGDPGLQPLLSCHGQPEFCLGSPTTLWPKTLLWALRPCQCCHCLHDQASSRSLIAVTASVAANKPSADSRWRCGECFGFLSNFCIIEVVLGLTHGCCGSNSEFGLPAVSAPSANSWRLWW
eukprot:g27077.t1